MILKLCFLLVFIITYSWGQSGSTKTFTSSGAFLVPAGVTSINVQAWGGGGSGGGASGGPLLLGRGAAGGGGGAYASAPISVTAGATLNVVVAGQTPGTNGNGTAGGNSTITGFESSILAAGGSGGSANNAGGTPSGGIGGTVAASVGSTKLAGLNGGNGNSWNLLGLLLSSGAGGNGANSGGAGGAAVSSLIFSNAAGSSGSAPGGAGSGGINSALGAAQSGGTGGAGQVIISYTCPVFNISSTSATDVCSSTGSTTTVTLISTAGALPVGNYVVTYNRSIPSATALTANLTVSTAGTGNFTVGGLTTAGSSTITITKLTSETCSSTITTNNTVTVIVSPATVGGTVTGGTTINSGDTSGVLNLSGHTGSVVKWQSSVSPFTTWTDIANTTTTYISGVLTETTQFRAVVQSGVCSVVNSEPTTVTVNLRPTITLSASTIPRCLNTNAQTTFLEYSATTGSPTTYSIVWNSSPANDFAAVTDAAMEDSPITIAVPAGIVAGTYIGTLTVKNAGGGVSTGYNFSVPINAPGSLITDGVVSATCSTNIAQVSTLEYTGTTVNPTSYSIDWSGQANDALFEDELSTDYAFDPNGGSLDIKVPANVVPGTYTGILYIFNGLCFGAQTISITITPGAVGGTVTGGTTIGSGSTSGLLTLSGQTGTVVAWESSVSPFTEWTEIDNTNVTYTSGPLTETTQFRAIVRKGLCPFAYSEPTTVTVQDLPTITLASNTISICGSSSYYGALPYTGTTGNPVSYSLVWSSSPPNSIPSVIDAVLSESPIDVSVSVGTADGTYQATLTVKDTSGNVSNSIVINANVETTPNFQTNGNITSVTTSASEQTTTLEYDTVFANPLGYSIDWNAEANAALLQNQPFTAFDFSPGSGFIDNVVVPANVLPGTYTGTLIVEGAFCALNSKPVTIIINSSGARGTIDSISGMVETNDYNLSQNPLSISTLNKVINVETVNQNINKVLVYDVSGDLVYKKDGVGDSKLSIHNLKSNGQVLVVKVILDNNQIKTKKIIY
ncbi:MAG: T9SS sorting signal type C domain-containing protein [Flavobacterium sp.]